MYDSMVSELNNRLSVANVKAQSEVSKGQQIGNALTQLGDAVTKGMSYYAQSTFNNEKYDQQKILSNGEKDFYYDENGNINPNAVRDYTQWVDQRLDEWANSKGGLMKGLMNDYRQTIKDSAIKSFDENMILRMGAQNELIAQSTWSKAIEAFPDENVDLSIFDMPEIYRYTYKNGEFVIDKEKVAVQNLYDTESEDLTPQEKRFNQLLNILYESRCLVSDQDTAKAYVESKRDDIEMSLVENEIIRLANDWGTNGRRIGNETKYYTPDELKDELKSYYLENNKRPYSDKNFTEKESLNMSAKIDDAVDTLYDTIHTASYNTIFKGMKDFWESEELKVQNNYAGIEPDATYKALAQEGLIKYDETTGKVIDHTKIDDKTWSFIEDRVETNKHLKIASDFAINPIDFTGGDLTGDGKVDLEDLYAIDPIAVQYIDYSQTNNRYFVPKNYGFRNITNDDFRLTESTMKYYTLGSDGSEENTALGKMIGTAYELQRANSYYKYGNDNDYIDEYAKQEAERLNEEKEWDELTEDEKNIYREQAYVTNESNIARIMDSGYQFVDESGLPYAGTASQAVERLKGEFKYVSETAALIINENLRGVETYTENALEGLNLLMLDGNIDNLICSAETGIGLYSEVVIGGLEERFNDIFVEYDITEPVISDTDIQKLKESCEKNGLDYDSAYRVYVLHTKANILATYGYEGANSSTDVLKNTLRSDVIPVAKKTFEENYDSTVSSLTSHAAWKESGSKYQKAKTFSEIDETASKLTNYEIYSKNSIDTIKAKTSSIGRLQHYYDAVLSGEMDYETAMAAARADSYLSIEDTDTFCGNSFGKLIELATGSKQISDRITKVINDYSDILGADNAVFNVLTSVLYNVGLESDARTVNQALLDAISQLDSEISSHIDSGLKKYTNKTESKFDYNFTKNKKNFSDGFDKALSNSKENMKDHTSATVVFNLVDDFLNYGVEDIDGYLTMFNELVNTDPKIQKNKLLVEAFRIIHVDTKLNPEDDEFASKFTTFVNENNISEGQMQLIFDIAGDLANRSEQYSTAKDNTYGVRKTQDSTSRVYETDKGMMLTQDGSSFVSLDGKDSISTEFLGNEVDGDFDYEPLIKSVKNSMQKALDEAYVSDALYKTLLDTVTYNQNYYYAPDTDYHAFTIIRDYYKKGIYDEEKTRSELELFFENNPYAQYTEEYITDRKGNLTISLDDYFSNVEKAIGKNVEIEDAYIAYENYAMQIALGASAYTEYLDNKKRLESPEFSSTGDWILPTLKPVIGTNGRIIDVVKIDK